jgi:peptide methionine sulfoxide reductase MsrA
MIKDDCFWCTESINNSFKQILKVNSQMLKTDQSKSIPLNYFVNCTEKEVWIKKLL